MGAATRGAGRSRDGLYKRGTVWWLRRDPVTGTRISTGCTDLGAARLWRAERERLAASPADARSRTEPVGKWLSKLVEMQRREGGDSKASNATDRLGPWVRIIGNDVMLCDVTADLVDTYVNTRRAEGVRNSTICKEWSYIRRALQLAKRAGAFPGDIDSLRPLDLHTDYVPRTRALQPTEVMALLRQLPPHRAAFVAVTTLLGLRYSEAMALQPEDIDLDAGTVFVRGTKTDEAQDTIPILPPFREVVAAARKCLPLRPWGSVCRDLAVSCRNLGIERCTPNDLRRTHCTMLVSAGVSLDVARRLMRHTTSAMVERVYGKPTPQAVGALASVANLPELPPIILGENFGTTTSQSEGDDRESGTPGWTRTSDQWIRKPRNDLSSDDSSGDSAGDDSEEPPKTPGHGAGLVQGRHTDCRVAPASWAIAYAYRDVLSRRAAA